MLQYLTRQLLLYTHQHYLLWGQDRSWILGQSSSAEDEGLDPTGEEAYLRLLVKEEVEEYCKRKG